MSRRNTFGNIFRVTTFGESHGPAVGAVIDGCPSGVVFDFEFLHSQMARRRPGYNALHSARREKDEVKVLSGVFEGRTLGTPICLLVENLAQESKEYSNLKDNFRAGHADDLWQDKFGHRDHRGGGRASARETAARVAAGSVAMMFLGQESRTIKFTSRLVRLGQLTCKLDPLTLGKASNDIAKNGDGGPGGDRFDSSHYEEAANLVAAAKANNDSLGGVIRLKIEGVARGLGQPIFNKLKADLAAAVLGIPAVIGIDFSEDSDDLLLLGSEFHQASQSRQYAGIRGGISTGESILMNVQFKPTSSIGSVARQGKHDPCVALRGSVVLEHMAALVIADHVLWKRLDRI